MKIVVLGDFNPQFHTHLALNEAIHHLSKTVNHKVSFDWRATDKFDFRQELSSKYAGLWIAPGSPYRDMDNVIHAIRFARENNIPTLGNCGGFQHMIIEFARNACGLLDADSEENHPDGKELIISKLSCSLVGQAEEITIAESTLLHSLVGKRNIVGKYHCSYALNPKYIPILEGQVPFRGLRGNMKMTATNNDGDIRAFEIESHPFFLGTLFQPALTSTMNEPDPILLGFVNSVNREA